MRFEVQKVHKDSCLLEEETLATSLTILIITIGVKVIKRAIFDFLSK